MPVPTFLFNPIDKTIHLLPPGGVIRTAQVKIFLHDDQLETFEHGDFAEAVRRHNEEGYRPCARCLGPVPQVDVPSGDSPEVTGHDPVEDE